MKIQTFNCTFLNEIEFQLRVTSEYPSIIKVESNLPYLLGAGGGEFSTHAYQGNSNRKTYKEYEDKKGKYIRYWTGASPRYVKIYKD